MKAAVVQSFGQTPSLADFVQPVPTAGEKLVAVTASAVSHLTKSRASGSHYSSSGRYPFVAGIDGVGRLDDGRRVYFVLPRTPYGGIAEWTVVPEAQCVRLPDEIDDLTAAAIANPGMSSWAAYSERAKLQRGETVLVNGATGTSGRLAVQIARHLGAAKIIATGRNAEALNTVASLGADATISLDQDDAALEDAFKGQFAKGINVVIDYLWGQSAERLLVAGAKAGPDGVPIRFVQVGAMSGTDVSLPGAVLRSSAIVLMGSGIGSVSLSQFIHVIGELFRAAVPCGLEIAFTPKALAEIGEAWAKDDSARRTVFRCQRERA